MKKIKLVALLFLGLLLACSAKRQPGEARQPTVEIKPRVPASTVRETLELNGSWDFLPGTASAAKRPTDDWGKIRVPGSWHDDVEKRGTGDAWQAFEPKKINKAWYHREFEVPADWKGRSVVLELDRVSTDAMVQVNGKEAGKVHWPAGELEITQLVEPGKTNEVLIMVLAMDDRTEVKQFMGYVDEPTMEAKLDSRGLIGDVELHSRPRGAYIYSVFAQPSVRQDKLFVHVELAEVAQSGEVTVTADMRDESGKLEKTFGGTAQVEKQDLQTIRVSFDWPDPRLWDYKQPNLYDMHLMVQGPQLKDIVVQRFGFREFWIEGRKFFMNGTEIHLRPRSVNSQYKGNAKKLLEFGANYAHRWPWDQVRRGVQSDYYLADIELTDKMGLPGDANLAHMRWYLDRWEKPEVREEYLRILNRQIRKYRNHPSVVMYSHTGNALGWAGDGDPWDIGMQDVTHLQAQKVRRQQVLEIVEKVKALDPKPVFAHHGADNGEVYTSNLYLNFIPLQEREEWISHWAEEGDLPYMVVEFGPPLYSSVMRGRSGYAHQGNSEPFPTEWAAVYFGDEAYTMESPSLRKLLQERFKGGDLQKEYRPHIRHDHKDQVIVNETGFKELLDLFITNTWRSWRTLGMTGGMVAWHSNETESLQRVNGDSLAWIAGPGGIPDRKTSREQALTEKTHHYIPGQTLKKQLVFINDYREPKSFTASYEVRLGGRSLGRQKLDGTLAVSEIRLDPVEVKLPKSIDGPKVRGSIELKARIGEQQHEHTFEFDILSRQAPAKLELSLFDPNGATEKYLKSLGYRVQRWTQGQPGTKVALVGRDALADGHQIPGDLKTWVRDGGRLMIMGQEAEWTEHALHLRTAPHLSRRAYPVSDSHPVVAGLDQENLRDWNGSSTTVDGYVNYKGYDWVPDYGWRWGNRHAVSSTPIEKPHRSSWRPILEAEFDLAYTPLMEMDYGRGRITFCTLDVEARTSSDPAANRLFGQLMRHVAKAKLEGKAERVVYVGDYAGRKLLDELGVQYVAGAVNERADVVIVGAGAQLSDARLRQYIQAGGRALVLRREAEQAPLGVKLAKAPEYHGSLKVPAWPQTAGLSASDLRWRANSEAWLVQPGDGVEVGADGQLGRVKLGEGVAIFAQVSPQAVPADEKRYFRFTRWRQTRALSQLLANLGVSFKQDDKMLALLKEPDHYVDLAGHDWKAALVTPVKESPDREWNPPKPMSAQAKALVQPNASLKAFDQVWVPAYMEAYGKKWQWVDGEVVFRKAIRWPQYAAGKPAFISVGRVDETETTFINGREVGASNDWLLPRGHDVPAGVLKSGENVIALRTWDEGIHGGMAGSPDDLFIQVAGEDPGFYHPDYISADVSQSEDKEDWKARKEQWKIADDPYRYYRW